MRDRAIKASVIIPTRNRSHCLRGAVESVLAQTYQNFEVVIVNDGSTDETKAVAEELAAADSRILVLEGGGNGQSAAVNIGLESAEGEIAIMLSDDDLLYPECLSSAIPVFQENPSIVVVAGEYDLIDWENRILSSNCSPEIGLRHLLMDHMCNIGVGAAFRVDASNRAGGWDSRYRHVPDLEFWMRMGLEGEFHYVPEKLGAWRVHDEQLSSHARVGSVECAEEHIRCIDEFLQKEELPQEYKEVASQAKATALVAAAVVMDPELCHSDRRFLVMDRNSLSLDESGHIRGTEERDVLLVATAEERLKLIHSLDDQLQESQAAANERLELVERLDADLQESLANIEELRGVLQEVQSTNAELNRRLQEGIITSIRRRLRL